MNLAQLKHIALIAALFLLPGAGWSLPWDKDMQNQPSIKAQETETGANEQSVPVGGGELYPAPKDMIELVRARLDAGEVLVNPVQKSPESLERGRQMFDIHCLVCHGPEGRGDGPVGKKFVPQPMDLTLDYVQTQPAGQLYYTISHGSIAMPFYRQSLSDEDRWNIINYVKKVFGPDE